MAALVSTGSSGVVVAPSVVQLVMQGAGTQVWIHCVFTRTLVPCC